MTDARDTSGRPTKGRRVYRNTAGNREITQDFVSESVIDAFETEKCSADLAYRIWSILTWRLLETDNPYLELSDAQRPLAQLKKSLLGAIEAVDQISELRGSIGRGHGGRLLDEILDRYNHRSVLKEIPHWEELVLFFRYVEDGIEDLFVPAPETRAEPYRETIRDIFSLFKDNGLNINLHENCQALAFLVLISDTYPTLVFPKRTKSLSSRYQYLRNTFRG